MLLGVDLELAENLLEDSNVRARLVAVHRPLLLQVLRDSAANCRLVDIDAAALVLERLKQKLRQLLHVQHGRLLVAVDRYDWERVVTLQVMCPRKSGAGAYESVPLGCRSSRVARSGKASVRSQTSAYPRAR